MCDTDTPASGWRRRAGVLGVLGVLGVIAALTTALLGAGAVYGSPQASAATVDASAWYVLQNRHSGKVMDVYEHATTDGAQIVQWSRNDGYNQQWRFVDVGGGYYKIRSRHSDKVLELPNAQNGTNLIQNADSGNTRQHFRLADSDGGYVRLVNRHSDNVLDVWSWSTADGGRIAGYTDLDGYNQQWQLVQVGNGGGDPAPSDCGSGSVDAEAVLDGGTWTATNGGDTVYTGPSMLEAMRAAVGSLTQGRTSKERVVVRGSGTMDAGQSLDLPSYTVLDVCGTIDVTGTPSGDNAVVRGRHVTDVEVGHLSVTGAPWFGIFFRNASNIHLGQIELNLSGGLGIRIDNHSDRSEPTRNVRIDDVYVAGTNNHGVETYGVDGLTIGTVVARDTAYSGLLLNDTVNAEVGTVDAEGAGTGTGYAAFRMANRNGRVGASYPTNVHVEEVVARGGGRGVFCVSESGGAVIDRVDIAQTGGNAILLENCHNVTIAAESGSVQGPGDIRIAARSEFPNSSDITIQNLTVTDSAINEDPCGSNITFRNNTLVNSSRNVC